MNEPAGGDPNPYAAPRSAIGAVPAGTDRLTREEVTSFAGKNAEYYWDKYTAGREGSWYAGWNWAAGFLNLLWLLYRRRYREFAIAVAIFLAWGVMEAILFEQWALERETMKGIERLGNLVVLVAFALFANTVYLRRLRQEALAARRLYPGEAERAARHAHLARRGGTSWAAVLIALGASIALGIAVAMSGETL